MEKSIILVDLPEIEGIAIEKGYEVKTISKGSRVSHEILHYDDAEKCALYDIIMLNYRTNLEEFRKMIGHYTKKNNVISVCYYNYDGNNIGDYLVTTINESLNDAEVHKSNKPSFDGLEAACLKYDELNPIKRVEESRSLNKKRKKTS